MLLVVAVAGLWVANHRRLQKYKPQDDPTGLLVITHSPFWILLGVIITGLWAANHFRWNDELSEPIGLYMVTHDGVDRGKLVILAMPMKVIAALPGDRVKFSPEGVYINGKYWPESAPEASIPHSYQYGTYTVPDEMFLAMGHNPDSYDSRYYGFVPLGLIKATAAPVWVK